MFKKLRGINPHDACATVMMFVAMWAWALIAFARDAVNFDLLGQQVLTAQWLAGMHDGTVVGATNYLFKMGLIYAPIESMALVPEHKILWQTAIILALACVVIAIGAKWLHRALGMAWTHWSRVGLVVIGLYAGSLFWVQYGNSRNIELGLAMCYVAYMVQNIALRKRSWHSVAVVLAGAVLYVIDPLMMYTLPLVIVSYTLLATKSWHKALWQAALQAAAVGGAKVLSVVLAVVLKLAYVMPAAGGLDIKNSMVGVARTTIQLFAPHYLGTWRIVGLAIALFVLGAVALKFRRWITSRKGLMIIVSVGAVYGIYIASGQAATPGTSRYLLWLVALIPIVLTMFGQYYGRRVKAVFVAALTVYVAIIGYHLIQMPFGTLRGVSDIKAVAAAQPTDVVYTIASYEFALGHEYFAQRTAAPTIAVACVNGSEFQHYHLFYDKAVLRKAEAARTPNAKVGVMLRDGKYSPGCDETSIVNALGQPITRVKHPAGETLVYDTLPYLTK